MVRNDRAGSIPALGTSFIIQFFFIVISVILIFSCTASAVEKVLFLNSGAKAYCYIPPYMKDHKYALLLVLHGKGYPAQTAYDYWHDIAVSNNLILLAPEGTGRQYSYFDNLRKNMRNVVKFTHLLRKQRYFTNDSILVAGFSMGGGFALDLAISHPGLYSKALCVFGFFQERHEKKLQKLASLHVQSQKFYFITQKDDVTYTSLVKAASLLTRKGAAVKLVSIPGLFHSYPVDFQSSYQKIFQYLSPNLTNAVCETYNNI